MSAEPSRIIEVPQGHFTRNDERDLPAVVNASPAHMLAVAVNRGMDAATIQGLMDLQERWERIEAVKEYNAAFAAFKAEAVEVVKNRDVTQGPLAGKSYAELIAWVKAVTPALSKHGLAASWRITKDEKDWIEVTCSLRHLKGHSESVAMGGPPDVGGAKSAIQARASTVSYLERYTLKAITGLAERGDDNDGAGEGASMPIDELREWVKKIEAATTKAAAKEACAAGIAAADGYNDLSAYKTLKDTLKAQNEFIDKADK